MNPKTSSNHNAQIIADLSQKIIKIEEPSTFQYSQNCAVIGIKGEENHNFPRTNEMLAQAIGVHQICLKDPTKQHKFDLHYISTDNFDLVDIQWQGVFQLVQDPLVKRYLIWMVSQVLWSKQLTNTRYYALRHIQLQLSTLVKKLRLLPVRQGMYC